jgi:His-Xaa-Ser system protein HxsD
METLTGQEEADRSQDSAALVIPQGVRWLSPEEDAHLPDRADVVLEVDSSIFHLNCVLRAAYKFTDRAFVFLSWKSKTRGVLEVTLKGKSTTRLASDTVGEFGNELLDQQVREVIEREFGNLRTLITAQAFSEGNLLDPQRDQQDYKVDPLGISRAR